MTTNRPYVCCVVHSEFNDLGRVGKILSRLNVRIKKINILSGDSPPQIDETMLGVIIFGGTMSVNDRDVPCLKAELSFIDKLMVHGIPLLGICLGGQLISQYLGGVVGRHEHNLVEIGFHELTPTLKGRALFKNITRFYQWHQENMPAPSDAEILATGSAFPVQAYSYNNALALQFHPDANIQTIRRWCELGRHRLGQAGAQSEEEQLRLAEQLEKPLDEWVATTLANLFRIAIG